MSCAEHLIESAIHHIESNKSYEDFKNEWYNKENSKRSGISLNDAWVMAVHVVYTFKSSWVSDTIAILKGDEPFDSDMKEYVEKFLQ